MIIVETSDRASAGKINRAWRAEHMSIAERLKISKSVEPQHGIGGIPAAVPTMVSKPLSQQAAEMQDAVHAMEQKIADLTSNLREMEVRAKTAEGMLAEERKEKIYLLNTNDKLLRRSAQLVALLNAAGDLIDRCKHVKDEPVEEAAKDVVSG